ncbi:MAG: glucosidase [Candidatus Velthaea sp.]
MELTAERSRMIDEQRKTAHWRRWGPYLSDRQWGTVREDYSPDGRAWDYFPFEQSRTRAYRWGEDGILGISDNHQRLCFAPAFWNENDPFLKERFFGLAGPQGNHGEDVKEYWYYLDNVPSHAYMKALYKYPQRRFPYERLVEENARRGRGDAEFELLDTGAFDDDQYFDITVEYAKGAPDDVCIRITATNRAGVAAPLHVLPTLFFRNEWSWRAGVPKPSISAILGTGALALAHATLGKRWFVHDGGAQDVLFTENETNYEATFGVPNTGSFCKDGIDRYVVRGDGDAVNPKRTGTKAAPHYRFVLEPGATVTIRLRLADSSAVRVDADFDAIFERRSAEADAFYRTVIPGAVSDDDRLIQRQAFAGLLWSKQFYNYVIHDWLNGDPLMPPPPAARLHGRNAHWIHVYNDDVLSMPDTWEYPWFAAWDLAFHVIPLAVVDPAFAKRQLTRLLRETYMHPNGQIPAYEWAFGDVNPPLHAWAAYRVYKIEAKHYGMGDIRFLERVFTKLLLNFTWWVNRKDVAGKNVFQGGFLGLDNIGVFDRSAELPTGGYLAQADGTSWMGVYALNMLAMAIELAKHDAIYEDVAVKFFEHFLYIADAINSLRADDEGLWDDTDAFYYDQLILPDGQRIALKVRSMVGLVPLFAVETISNSTLEKLPRLKKRIDWFCANRPELSENVASIERTGLEGRRLMAIVQPEKVRRILRRFLDEAEFLSPYGLRSLSKYHAEHPYVLCVGGATFKVDYEPAESQTYLFGGNSNWRGPVWFPLNYLFIEALQRFHFYLGDAYTVEFPTGSGKQLTLWQVSMEIAERLIALFRRDTPGGRPVFGERRLLQDGPHWRDLIAFHEYFHGDTGAGLGASHQTGWTALVAKLIQQAAEYAGPERPPLAWDFEVPIADFSHV